MRRVTAVLSAAAIVLTTIGVMAQAKPDFSGTWTLVPAEGGGGGGGRGGRGGGGGGWGMSPTIKQSGNTLSVSYTMGRGGGDGQAMTVTYDLSGKPTTRTMMGRGGEQQVTDTATWNGSSLVIVTKTAQAEQRRTVSLKDGNLVIEYNSGREGATPQTITYKKG